MEEPPKAVPITKSPRSNTTALSLLQTARSYRDAARGMCGADGHLSDQSQMPAFCLLTSFGLEVAMKSHLRHLGVPDFPDLKDLGHDLAAIASDLDRRGGILDFRTAILDITARLGPSHKNLIMRYTPDGVSLSLPNAVVVMEVLDALVDGMAIRLLFGHQL